MRGDLRIVLPSSILVLALTAACAPTTSEAPAPPQPTAAPATPPPAPPMQPAPAPPPAPPTPRPMQMGAHTVQLMSVNESGVTGTATIRGAGMSNSEVRVELTGAPGAGTHQGHIHSGTCESIGAPVFPLEPVIADSSGAGMSTTQVGAQPMTLMDGRHLIAFHAADGEPGEPVVCGEIPMMEMRH